MNGNAVIAGTIVPFGLPEPSGPGMVDRPGMVDLDTAALAGDNPYERVGDYFGADVVRDTQPDDLPGEGVAVAVGKVVRVSAAWGAAGAAGWVGAVNSADTAGSVGAAGWAGAVALDAAYEGGDGDPVEVDVEEPRPGDLDGGDALGTAEMGPQDLGHLPGRPTSGPGQLQGDVRGVVPAAAGPRRSDHGSCGHGHAQLPLVHGATHRAQHGAGELDRGHGTSVWEEGGGYASRFAVRSGMWTGKESRSMGAASVPGPGRSE